MVISNGNINELLVQISTDSCEKAYKELFMYLHNNLQQFAYSIVKSQEDAEEIVSDLFIHIWQKRDMWQRIDNPKLYFYVSIKNACFNRLKQNNRIKSVELENWEVKMKSIFFNPEQLYLSAEVTQSIMQAINQLPPKCKIIFKLIKEDGLKYAEVAQLLELSIKTIEAQMAIALRRIKTCLEFKHEFRELNAIISNKKNNF